MSKHREDTTSKTAIEIIDNGLKERKSWGNKPGDDDEMIDGGIVIFSAENFDEDCITPQGFLEGETGRYDRRFIPTDDALITLDGRIISNIDFCSGNFFPDFDEQIWSDDDTTDDGDEFYRAPKWAGGRMSFYRNPHRKMKARGKIVNRYY